MQSPDGPAPRMIFRDPSQSGYAMYVRSEERPQIGGGKQVEHLFVFIKNQMMYQRWAKAIPEEYEFVNDVAGRKEAALAWAECQALQIERDALLSCMRACVALLDERAANEIRGIYSKAMEKAELVSVSS